MNRYLTHLLVLYKNKQLPQEIALSLIEQYRAQHQGQQDASKRQKIAIIGLSARMPLADNAEIFWENLVQGINCVRAFPQARRKDTDHLLADIHAEMFVNGRHYWKGGFLEEVDKFDNDFFEILPAEAKVMDPHQRIFLELAHEAFQDAGYTREQLRGSNTGIYLGDVMNEYHQIIPHVTASAVVGNVTPFISSRIAYFYDMHGPTVNISTTCSTSLVAIHTACQAIINNECDLALAGAINLRLFPFALKDDPVDALGITTEDGFCRAFDNDANGIVRGEGGGAFVLKSYEKALEDRDYIYAIILGSAVNNDGRSSGIGAPNPLAHEQLFKKAWERSNIDPRTIQYIEGHGTGTKIGDPIEVHGITCAFSSYTTDKQFCGLGSVKTNIGHLTGGASGFSGMLKTVLAIKNKLIPPTLHFERPNELINFADTSIYITDQLMPWPQAKHARRAAVNAFGFNGTNCHLVMEEGNETPAIDDQGKEYIFVASHNTEVGLKGYIQNILRYMVKHHHTLSLANVCYTMAIGRDHFKVRCAIVASSLEGLLKKMTGLLKEEFLGGKALEGQDYMLNQLAQRSLTEKVAWKSHYQGTYYKVSLPPYNFERRRFWIDNARYTIRPSTTIATDKELVHDLQAGLLNIITGVMGLENISLEDNFFDLGGDSLLGIQLINEIHKYSNKKITYQDLFNNPRFVDLLQLLQGKEHKHFQQIAKLAPQENYTLSFGQRRLWILHQMQDHPIAYNMYEAYKLHSRINLEYFKKSLDGLVARHAALRTIFSVIDGEPVQKFIAAEQFDFTIIDLSDDPQGEQSAKNKIDIFKLMPFDLERGPLARALLLTLSADRHIFFLVMHHIISDGWSMRLIIQDLLKGYRALNIGALACNQPLIIDYADYAHWQQLELSQEKFRQLENYWINKFSSTLPVCEILGDKPRPSVFTFEGARKQFLIHTELVEKMTLIAQRQNATLFMALLSAVYIFIYRYSGQPDILVGTPVSGRSHTDLKYIVGFFVNTLILRGCVNPVDNFSQLLSMVRDNVLEAFEHQDYPFDLLVDKLNLERDTSHSPLFNINVAFQNFELDEASQRIVEELNVQRYELRHHSCKWDLEFEFVKQLDGSILTYLEYYSGIYSNDMIDIMRENFIALLQAIAQAPLTSINCLPMKFEAVNLRGEDHYGMAAMPPDTIHRAFERQVLHNPNLPAVKEDEASISYDELNKRANQLAHFLVEEKQTGAGALIGILMSNSTASIIAILGILKAGCAYVPLDIKSPVARLKVIIEEGGIQHLISVAEQLSLLNSLLWSSATLASYLCLDVDDAYSTIERQNAHLMDPMLWNHVVQEATDDITASGWISSYTGRPFSLAEMQEYQDNTLQKLIPFLGKECNVLEIGCGSGLTAFAIAPYIDCYVGTDLSSAIIARNISKAQAQGHAHLHFYECMADQISGMHSLYDVVIMNSVVHCFPGLNYLRNVIKKALDCCSEKAVIFLGDLMDQELKSSMEKSFDDFKDKHQGQGCRTKTDWSRELFVSRLFIEGLQIDFPMIKAITFSNKMHTIENELTLFRYDALLIIDKSQPSALRPPRKKSQHGWAECAKLADDNLSLACPTDLAYVLFTSGSTGIPKGVMVEHQTVCRYIDWANQTYYQNGSQGPCYPFYSSFVCDLTVTSILSPLLSGSYLRVLKGEFDEVLHSIVLYNDCNILKLTPTHLAMLIAMQQPLPSIRKFILGGEALHSGSVNALHHLYESPVEVYNEYGPTEATVGCIVYKNNQYLSNESQMPIGLPMSHVEVHLLNEDGHPVPIGGVGEICVGGGCLARGYLNNATLTAEKFMHNPLNNREVIYRTGDLGRCLPNGLMEYIGRNDRQVKMRGYRIELNEIEAKLYRHTSVKLAAVVLNEHNGASVICAYYASQHGTEINGLQEFLQAELPHYMVPGYFVLLNQFPLSSGGKIDYLKLPDPFFELSRRTCTPPRNATEVSLAEIWCSLLGISQGQLGIEDDFFDLGGDSIIAMRMIPKVKAIGCKLSIKDIFQHRTIKALSQFLSEHDRCSALDACPPILVLGDIPLTPIQKWFLEHNMSYPEYFNMSYMFKIAPHVHEERLEEAFMTCIAHHDILRVAFNHGLQRCYAPKEAAFELLKVDYTHLPHIEQERHMEALSLKLQGSFALSTPPLLKAALIDLGNKEKRLLIIIHHLIIDGVSWRFLIEDIETLYHSNLTAALPPKSQAYSQWAERQWQAACNAKLDIGYWLNIDISKLAGCLDKGGSHFIMKNYYEETFFLDAATTRRLFSSASTTYSVNDILLSALQLALLEQFQCEELLIDHEGHGRCGFDDMDLSRTLGWCTTIYPLLLKRQSTIEKTLQFIKRTLHRLSSLDINFGIARFLQGNLHLQKMRPRILFNYFGRVGADLLTHPHSLLTDCAQLPTPTSHADNQVPHALEINAIAMEEHLKISWLYDTHSYHNHTIETLQTTMKIQIQMILDYLSP